MNAYDIIYKKRQGGELSRRELNFMIKGLLKKEVPEYQISAFLMAVYFKGMVSRELADLTEIMVESGEQVDLSAFGKNAVDKHSTGGVGDGVSLTLAPLAASLGIVVPKMSGRALGHTGGTLDKLESIPGCRVELSVSDFKKQLESIGVAIISQTENIAPADKRLYELRDVTATVESIPMIAASIMSKKIAEGASGLVLDVKSGNGAFMRKHEDARKLADYMEDIGTRFGRKTIAMITDMNQPLGRAIGNACEVKQAIDLMKGSGPADIKKLIVELVSEMAVMAEIYEDKHRAKEEAIANLSNGMALEKFGDMIEFQKGDRRVCDNPEKVLPKPRYYKDVIAQTGGCIRAMDTRSIGLCVSSLGTGRKRIGQKPDYSAGILVNKKVGEKVEKGEPLARLFSSREEDLSRQANSYRRSVIIN